MILPDEAARARGEAPLALLGFLALMTSVVALTIDAVLPALDAMSHDLAFAEANDRHLIVMLVFAGLGLGQILFGPLADIAGRKRTALLGWAVFLAGTVLGMLAWTPEALFAGRFLQGVGAAGPRVVATTIVRDLFTGRAMARVMSVVMTIFMLVPMLAPLIGQGIEYLAGWRAIFGFYMAAAAISAVWYILAVPETLPPERRRPAAIGPLLADFREVVGTRQTVICILATVCVFGAFMTFLATAQQIFEELYGLGPLFPVAFGGLAAAFAAAAFTNSRVVMRLGMLRLARVAFLLMAGAGVLGVIASLLADGQPPFWLLMLLLAAVFVAAAQLFGNLNALAVQPLGHIAGMAASVVFSLSTVGASLIAGTVSGFFDGTSLVPLFTGFAVLGVIGAGLMWLSGEMDEGVGRPEAAA